MKQDIKKDTLKAQLDDALRQSIDGTLLVNPEMVTKQLEIIFQEQTKALQDKLKTAESKAVDYSIQHDHYLEQIEQLKDDKNELVEGLNKAYDFISLAGNSYKMVNNKTSEGDVFRIIQSRGSQLKDNKFIINLLTKHNQNGNNI